MRAGLRFSSVDWRELWAFVRYSPKGSALGVSLNPDSWVTPEIMLLRDVEYGIRYLLWMQSEDGTKRRNRPERRLLTDRERRAANPERYRYNAVPLEEMAKFLGWDRPKSA